MTKPVIPTPPAGAKVVEMDAIDVMEWEQGQRTPQASDANLAALVERSAHSGESARHDGGTSPRAPTSPTSVSRPPRASDAPGRMLPPLPQPGRRNGPAMGPLPGVATPAMPMPAVRASTQTPVVAMPVVRASSQAPVALPGVRSSAPIPIPPAPVVEPAARGTGARPPRLSSPSAAEVARGGAAKTDEGAPSKRAVPPARPGSQPPDPRAAGSAPLPGVIRGPRPAPYSTEPTAVVRPPRPGSQPPAQPRRGTQPPSIVPSIAPALDPVASGADSPGHAWPGAPALGPAGQVEWSATPTFDDITGAGRSNTDAARWLDETAPGRPTALAQRPGSVSFDDPTRVVRVPQAAGHASSVAEPPAVPLPLPAPIESARVLYPPPDDRSAPPRGHDRAKRHGTTETSSVRIAPSRRKLWWTGGAAVCVAVVAVIALLQSGNSTPDPAAMRGEDGPDRPAAPEPAPPAGQAADTPSTDTAPAEPPAAAAPAPAAAAIPAAPVPAVEAAPTASPTKPPVNRPVRRLGGKKLVVEYNDRSSDAPGLVAQAAEDPAITRARTAYLSGNRKLFDGDVDGAIAAYQASLELYPGYVGGYRGLGLAYAQRGDRDQALEALQTYVTTVPGAKDVVLIKKRIARLQGK